MFINCYYYGPHTHSMLIEHLDHDLDHMARMGVNAVSLCISELHLELWTSKRLERVCRRIRAHGMEVYAVPNRWSGLVAGWMDGFNGWSVEHANCLLPGYPPHQAFADPSHPATREHYERTLRRLFEFDDFEGLIWDEPCPGIAPVIEFLDAMTGIAKSLRPELTTSLFLASPDLDLSEILVRTQNIDYLGADGHIRDNDYRMHRMKTTIFEAHAKHYPVLAQAGKKTFFLLEAQRHRDEDLGNYLENVERAFSLPMDQLMFYYSAHEMLDPEKERKFNQATWDAVRRVSASLSSEF